MTCSQQVDGEEISYHDPSVAETAEQVCYNAGVCHYVLAPQSCSFIAAARSTNLNSVCCKGRSMPATLNGEL
jgi:hypothetical protein